MRLLTEIIVHCAATRQSWMSTSGTTAKVKEIKRWHIANGWSDIGYHYIIDRNGVVATGRALSKVGSHVAGRNANTVGICLIGGHGADASDAFLKNYTASQDKALRELIDKIRLENPSITAVSGHNEFSNKACPGFNVKRWYAQKPERRITESKTMIGATTTGTATVASEVTREAQNLLSVELLTATTDTKDALEPIADALPLIRWICVGLALVGVGLVIYSRYKDWKAGRK